jgi:hypothetical protein
MLRSRPLSGPILSSRRLRRPARSPLLLVCALVLTGLAISATPALATTTVNLYAVPTGGAGSGSCQSGASACSFSYALGQATAGGYATDALVINLAPGTYADSDSTVSGGSLDSLEIVGETGSPAGTVFDGAATYRDFTINAGYPVTLQALTLQNGSVSGFAQGADVLEENSGGSLTLQNVVVNGGVTEANYGLADVSAGTLNLLQSTIENAGTSSADSYGTVATGAAALNITQSSIIDNTSGGVGIVNTGPTTILSSTLSNNAAAGIFDGSTSSVSVDLSTIAGSRADGGVYTQSGTTETIALGGDVLASNTPTDCHVVGSAPVNEGSNISDDGSCGFGTADGSLTTSTAAIGLLALANNGGPTVTQRITASSAAYDVITTGTYSLCALFDERGIARTQPGATKCAAGAYQPGPPTLTGISAASAEPGTSITLSGSNLNYVTPVLFGGHAGTVVSESASSVVVKVPALAVGSAPITVANADGTATIAFVATGPTITTTGLPSATASKAYTQTLAASGGTSQLSWVLAAGSTLPIGLTLSTAGTISGTPTLVSSSSFTVQVTDAAGASSTATLTLIVLPQPQLTIKSSTIELHRSQGKVDLACRLAACVGEIEITTTVHKTIKKGHKKIKKTETVVLASGSYRLAAGAHGQFPVKLSKAGHAALGGVALKPVHETLLATVTAGKSATRKIKIT